MTNSRFKFRVWNKLRKEWDNRWLLGADGEPFFITNDCNNETKTANKCSFPEDIEVVQSTGLFDCEGREVWEGDIVEILVTNNLLGDKKFISLVQYSNELHGCPNCHSCSEFLASGLFIPDLDAEAIEWREGSYFKVIGNRFENPELLERKR